MKERRKAKFLLGLEILCHVKNVEIYPAFNIEPCDVSVLKGVVIRGSYKRNNVCNNSKNALNLRKIECCKATSSWKLV